jgi:hypothetical protein
MLHQRRRPFLLVSRKSHPHDGHSPIRLAEFCRRLLGWRYRPGDEPPATGEADPAGQDWLVLRDAAGNLLHDRSDDPEEPFASTPTRPDTRSASS